MMTLLSEITLGIDNINVKDKKIGWLRHSLQFIPHK